MHVSKVYCKTSRFSGNWNLIYTFTVICDRYIANTLQIPFTQKNNEPSGVHFYSFIYLNIEWDALNWKPFSGSSSNNWRPFHSVEQRTFLHCGICLTVLSLNFTADVLANFKRLKRYFNRQWIQRTSLCSKSSMSLALCAMSINPYKLYIEHFWLATTKL